MQFKLVVGLLAVSILALSCSHNSSDSGSNNTPAAVSDQGMPVVDASAFPKVVPKGINSALPSSPPLTAQQKSDFLQLFAGFNDVAEPTFAVVGSAQSTSAQIQAVVQRLPVSEQMLAYALQRHCALQQPVVTNINPNGVPTIGTVTSSQTKSSAGAGACEVSMATNVIDQTTIIALAQNLLNSVSNVQQFRRVSLQVQSGSLMSSTGVQNVSSEIQALGRAEVGFSGGAREYQQVSGAVDFVLASGESIDLAVTGEILNQDQLTSQTQLRGAFHGVDYVINVQTLYDGSSLATKVYLNGEYLENGIPGLQFLQ